MIYWITYEHIPGVNIFPQSEHELLTVDNSTEAVAVVAAGGQHRIISSTYNILVQPLGNGMAAQGYYECSITLKDAPFRANRAVYYSDALYIGNTTLKGVYKYKTKSFN